MRSSAQLNKSQRQGAQATHGGINQSFASAHSPVDQHHQRLAHSSVYMHPQVHQMAQSHAGGLSKQNIMLNQSNPHGYILTSSGPFFDQGELFAGGHHGKEDHFLESFGEPGGGWQHHIINPNAISLQNSAQNLSRSFGGNAGGAAASSSCGVRKSMIMK